MQDIYKIPSVPDYTTINRRINKLHVKINEHIENDIVIAIDGTGIKVTNRGEWMRHKWHVRKGYLKLHVAVDTDKKKIVSLEITSEEVHDGKILKKLVDNALEDNNVKRAIGDGCYDSKDNFQYLSTKSIHPAIRVRKNSSDKSIGCYGRMIVVLKQKRNCAKWKSSVGYGYRWVVEGVFSSMKRMFGEYVSARKFPNMVQEMIMKTSLYNMFTDIK